MSKVKLLRFEIASMISDSKPIVEYLQKCGNVHLEDYNNDELCKYDTSSVSDGLLRRRKEADKAISLLEKSCEIKRGLIESFTDYKTISYERFKAFSEKNDETYQACREILELYEKTEAIQNLINDKKRSRDCLEPWKSLDIVPASKRTMSTRIYIGSFTRNLTADNIRELILSVSPELEDVAAEVISSEKLFTCAVIVCHISSAEKLEEILNKVNFIPIEEPLPVMTEKTINRINEEIAESENELKALKAELVKYISFYDDLRFLSDYLDIQIDKYKAVELAGTTDSVFFISGYISKDDSEELKFSIENNFTAYVDLSEPDYENCNVPVLLNNGNFANGVEGITEMYSPPSNKDVDPNPVMSFFYYAFFGLMLSDAGYGIMMVLASIFAEKKLKVRGNKKKTVNMIFYCGISAIIFGALFGSWFGDLIPVICTTFLNMEKGPDLALWLDPVSNSITLLIYCLGFGILHLFAGVMLNGYKLFKNKQYLASVLDTVPVIVFVCGFAIFGAGFLITVPESLKAIGNKLLISGAVLIVLTAGRSAKNIFGKFGAGLYALYNTTSGYLGDILSYSRLLALSLVTGVIASSINLMATMPGNKFLFVLILLVGHTTNIAINLIGTYVHTNRLQYVEFFSKFYEGEGTVFTPFKINSKHIIIKEDK